MRGVPREREAISAAPSAVELDAEQAGGAVHDLVELVGLVELQVGGEAEPVAQRAGQQPGAGGGADQRERRDLERDGGRARALADDDVDPEVLHRHVEHLLGRPRHPVDLVDEQDVAVVQPGQDRGEVAGVGDRRAAGEPQRRASSRAAMIIASVVLPSPGGPESSTWSGARPRRRAASSTSPSWSRTRAWPTTSSRVRGRSAASTARSSPSASAAVSDCGRWACSSAWRPGRPRRVHGSGLAQRAEGGAEQRGDVGLRRRPRARPRRRPSRRPWPTSRGRPGPGAPGRARAPTARARRGRRPPIGAPMRSLSSRMIRWAPFWPMPGTRVRVLTSSAATARRRSSGASTASIAWASLGPTPDAVCTSSKI